MEVLPIGRKFVNLRRSNLVFHCQPRMFDGQDNAKGLAYICETTVTPVWLKSENVSSNARSKNSCWKSKTLMTAVFSILSASSLE